GVLAAGISVSALAYAGARTLVGSQDSEAGTVRIVAGGDSASTTSQTALAAAGTPTAAQYADLRARHSRMLTGGSDLPVATPYTGFVQGLDAQVTTYLANLNEAAGRTFLWNDQAAGTGSANMTSSFVRLRAMAIQYSTAGSTYSGNSSLLSKTISGLQWLSTNKFYPGTGGPGNWWDWDIGSPLAILDAVIVLGANVPSALRTSLMSAVDFYVSGSAFRTAANLAWLTRCAILHSIVVESATKFSAARSDLLGLFANVTSGDGFYADGSFIQHAIHPYTGGYGNAMLFQLAWIVHLLGDPSTNWVAPADWALVKTWIWDAFEPLVFRGGFSPSVLGRNIARNNSNDHSSGAAFLAGVILLQAVATTADAATLKSLVKAHVLADTARDFFTFDPLTGIGSVTLHIVRLGWGIRNDAAITGLAEASATTIFPRMDRFVHRAPGWALSVAGFSARTGNYEMGNGENLHGWYTANGTVYHCNQQKLDHFQDDYWPTVDPYRMPGTTIDKRPRTNGESQSSLGQATSLVGGVSDQNCGVAVMTVNRDGGSMLARKSYIFIGDYIVFQGSGITNTTSYGVETVIENRNIGASGANLVRMNSTSNTVLNTLGASQTLAANWLHIEGLGGLIFKAGNPTINGLRSERSGRWSDINADSKTPTDLRTRRYLTLWFDHGVAPTNGSYGYAFMPSATASATGIAYTNNQVRWQTRPSSHFAYVLQSGNNVYGAAFWASDTNGIFQASAPVVVIVRVTNGRMAITCSDPLQTQTAPITITVQLPSSGIIWTSAAVTASRTATTATVTFSPAGMKGKSGQAVFLV
ncbi:MAG: hypothetical protein EON59_09315, partial [Alphaproteobacteria bacterium]